MASEQIQNQIRTAIQAAQSGNKGIARHILEEVLKEAPDTELAWLWLASVVDTVPERRNALQRVLALNPNNEQARQALAQLPAPEGESADVADAEARSDPSPPTIERRPAPSSTLRRPAQRPAPPATTRRPTPAPGATPSAEPAQAAAGTQRRRARRTRGGIPQALYSLGIFAAIVMIGLGVLLLVEPDAAEIITGTATPTSTPTMTWTPPPGYTVTPTPTGTPAPVDTLGPTWTPTITPTATSTFTQTPTLVPLNEYSLLVSGKRSGTTGWRLYTMRADGSQQQVINLVLPETEGEDNLVMVEVYDAAYSPDQTQIAGTVRLRRGVTEYEDIFIAPVSGGDIRLLNTPRAEHVEDVTWSGDGRQVAFASDAEGDFDIYSMPVLGGEAQILTLNDAEDRDPAWSPVDDVILYASDQASPNELEIFSMDTNGQNIHRLTEAQNSSFAPAWSSDGTQIVFLSDRNQRTDLFTMTASGTQERSLIVRDVPREERDPAWSPDGDWISFSSNREGPIFDLYMIRPDGTDLQRITQESGDTRFAVWSP